MAQKLGEAFVKITADMRSLTQGLAQAQAQTTRAVANIVEQLGFVEKALSRVRNIGLGLTVGVSLPMALATKGFLGLGSAAIELDNRFKITFGEMAKDVDQWSKQLAFAFRRGDTEIKQFVSTFNKMLVPVGLGRDATVAMSKELTQLVFDFASFEDQDPARVFRAFQGALVGMPRALLDTGTNLKEFNVKAFALKTGIAEVGKEMTEAQKVVARFGLLMDVTKQQQGDVARTSGEWASQTRTLTSLVRKFSENIGRAMIPTLRPLLVLFNDGFRLLALWGSEFAAVHPKISGVAVVVAGLVSAIGPLLVATVAAIGLWVRWKISAVILRGAMFALSIQIKGVTVANWLMNRSFVFTKALIGLMSAAFLRLKLALISVSAHFKIASISSISFASVWAGAAGIIAAGAALVTGAFRLMWTAILGPVGLAIIAITALAFVIEHLLAKKAMKTVIEKTEAMGKAMKALTEGAGVAGDAGGAGGIRGLGRTVSGPVLEGLAAGGEGFSRIFGSGSQAGQIAAGGNGLSAGFAGATGALGIKPSGDQLVAGEIRKSNDLLTTISLAITGPYGPATAILN